MKLERRLALAVMALTSALLLASNVNADSLGPGQRVQLTLAIESMQNQSHDRFLVVEIPGQENYFQFAGDGPNGYIFDLPTRSLSAEQQARAADFFSSRGIKKISSDATDPHTRRAFVIESYQMRFDQNDPGAGAELGLAFMFEVLRYSGDITIVEGWR